MIKAIGEFMQKWGNLLGVLFGIFIALIGLILQLRGTNSYPFYFEKFKEVVDFPIWANYVFGFVFVSTNLRREWFWGVKRRLKKIFHRK
ncbi:hypothetical protein [Chitinophaga sp. Cy-1792]|uniref:hypothetical protein n=1 Tax=Chitinophaga sp. Cy-1792 TaxID=2608339 RepID=UPI00141E00B5|nr:hypothetical protein [Chitinophaga sp. Cy-1792]NIG52798.1 hypothetical protein [Chitinophaga sp. Cy-1792]